MVSHLVKAVFVNTTEEHTLHHLARIYIENAHEDMIRLGCPEAAKHDTESARKEAAINAYLERVKHLYPPEQFGDPTDPQSNGGV